MLESGGDRGLRLGRARAFMGRRPPRWAVQAVAAAVVATAVAGIVSVASITDSLAQQRRDAAVAAALAAEPDLAARPLGGTATREGNAATGRLVLEVRNGRQPLRLLAVTAEVPGVRFSAVAFVPGRVLSTDDRLEVGLRFVVPDCGRVERAGRVVLRVAAQGVERDLTLAVAADAQSGAPRQVNLDVVLDACR